MARIATLVPVFVGLNLLGISLCTFFGLPFWMDHIGTFLAAATLGPVWSLVTLTVYHGFRLFVNPWVLPLYPIPASVAITAGLMFWWGWGERVWKWCVTTGLAVGATSTITYIPLVLALFGGLEPLNWLNMVSFVALSQASNTVVPAMMVSSGLVIFVDRLVTGIITLLIMRALPIDYMYGPFDPKGNLRW